MNVHVRLPNVVLWPKTWALLLCYCANDRQDIVYVVVAKPWRLEEIFFPLHFRSVKLTPIERGAARSEVYPLFTTESLVYQTFSGNIRVLTAFYMSKNNIVHMRLS